MIIGRSRGLVNPSKRRPLKALLLSVVRLHYGVQSVLRYNRYLHRANGWYWRYRLLSYFLLLWLSSYQQIVPTLEPVLAPVVAKVFVFIRSSFDDGPRRNGFGSNYNVGLRRLVYRKNRRIAKVWLFEFRAGDTKAQIASDPNFCKTLRASPLGNYIVGSVCTDCTPQCSLITDNNKLIRAPFRWVNQPGNPRALPIITQQIPPLQFGAN